MNAIEVLSNFKRSITNCDDLDGEMVKALDEALLALEKLGGLRKDAEIGFNYMSSQAKSCPNKEYAKGSRDVWQEVKERVGVIKP